MNPRNRAPIPTCANPTCGKPLPILARRHARTCSTRCRVALHRSEQRLASHASPQEITCPPSSPN